MKCKSCGCEAIEFTRLEEIGMNANDLLLEKCEQQQNLIKELEARLDEVARDYEEQRKRVHALGALAYKLDEIREVMTEVEFGDFSSIEEENKEDDE